MALPKYHLNPQHLKQVYSNLAQYVPQLLSAKSPVRMPIKPGFRPDLFELTSGEDVVFAYTEQDYFRYEAITQIFMSDLLAKVSVNGQITGQEYWEKHSQTIKRKFSNENDQREYIRKMTKEPATFSRCAVALIIKLFFTRDFDVNNNISSMCRPGPCRTVLDPSIGWGDRFISCMALGIEKYIGTDPDISKFEKYAEMATLFEISSERFSLIPTGFLEAEIDQTVDLCLTSPPFFDYERYSNDESQSVIQYPELDDWITFFLLPYLDKAWSHVRDWGILAINMDNAPKIIYVERAFEHMQKKLTSRYLGCLRKDAEKLKVPIYIWRKVPELQMTSFAIQTVENKFLLRDDMFFGGTMNRCSLPRFVNSMVVNNISMMVAASYQASSCLISKSNPIIETQAFWSGATIESDLSRKLPSPMQLNMDNLMWAWENRYPTKIVPARLWILSYNFIIFPFLAQILPHCMFFILQERHLAKEQLPFAHYQLIPVDANTDDNFYFSDKLAPFLQNGDMFWCTLPMSLSISSLPNDIPSKPFTLPKPRLFDFTELVELI